MYFLYMCLWIESEVHEITCISVSADQFPPEIIQLRTEQRILSVVHVSNGVWLGVGNTAVNSRKNT